MAIGKKIETIGCLPLKIETKGLMPNVTQTAMEYKKEPVDDAKFTIPTFKEVSTSQMN